MATNKNSPSSGIFDFLTFPLREVAIPAEAAVSAGTVLVLAEPSSPELDEFLQKIMAAVGCDLAKDAVVIRVTPDQKFRFAPILQTRETEQAVLFGVQPANAGLNFKTARYRPMQVGGINFLFADQLSHIHATPALKRPLWEGLKMVFGN